MKLKYKIFITMIFTSGLILLLTMGVMQFNIRKNFIEFVNDVEFDKLSVMMDLLKESYTRNGGWEDLEGDPEAWRRLLTQARPKNDKFASPPPFPVKGKKRRLPPIPNGQGPFHRRLCLFDADKNHVAGVCRQHSHLDLRPIVTSGHTIG